MFKEFLTIRFGNRVDTFSIFAGGNWDGGFIISISHNTVWDNGSFNLRMPVTLWK